jgi:hypothetical protein
VDDQPVLVKVVSILCRQTQVLLTKHGRVDMHTAPSLMQESNPISRILAEPTKRLEVTRLLPPPLRPRRKLRKRTTLARPTVTVRKRGNPIIDIKPDELVPLRPRTSPSLTRQQLKDDAAAHGRDLRLAPLARMRDVRRGQMRVVADDVERSHHGRDVAVVHEAEEEGACGGSAVEQQIRRCVQPEPAHGGGIALARAGAVVVQEVAGVFEGEEVGAREDGTPGAAAADGGFEAAHFLHREEFLVGEGQACLRV